MDCFLSYGMKPHQEMADYLSKRKIGWNKLKAFLPDLDECIYRYALFSGLQDLPEDLYKDTINIIKYSANVTKTEMSVHHISGVLMQRAMEIHGTKEKELSTDRALQAKTPDRFQHASRTNTNYRPRNQQRSQSYTIGGKQNKPVKCFECGSIEHAIHKCPFVTCSNCGAKGHMAGACRNSANQVEDIAEEVGLALMASDVSHSSSDQIIIDSGASRPFTGNPKLLSDYSPTASVTVKIADGRVYKSIGVGTMRLHSIIDGNPSELVVPNTYYIKEFHNTLLSAIDLTDRDYILVMKKNQCKIFSPDNKIKAVALKEHGLFRLTPSTTMTASALQVSTFSPELDLWHRRLGHVNTATVVAMVKTGAAHELPLSLPSSQPRCETCIQSKQTRKSLPKAATFRASHTLELVHSDVCGPFLPSLGGGLYFITFIDDFSRYGRVFILKSKADALQAFKRYRAEAETETGNKIKTFRSDRGVNTLENCLMQNL